MRKKVYTFREKEGEKVPEDTTHLVFHPSVTRVPQALCFEYKQLVSVDMGDNIKMVDQNAFRNCTSLQQVRFSPRLLYIGMWAFCGCAMIESLALPSTLKVIEYEAFMLCTSLRVMHIPRKNMHIIGEGAVRHCPNLLPSSITSSANHHEEYIALSPQEQEDELVSWLKHRFDDYPLHELCLDACVEARDIRNHNKRENHDHHHLSAFSMKDDETQMTPLHILTINPNVSPGTILACFRFNPSACLDRDIMGLNPIDYAQKNSIDSLVTLITALCINHIDLTE